MKEVICNLCGQDDWEVRFWSTFADGEHLEVDAFRCTSAGYGSHPQIVQCRKCGHVYANPSWDPDELLAAYTAVEDETYLHERVGRERTFTKHLQSLERFAGHGEGRALLDVGAYIGVFVEVALAHGWDAIGVEPSEWAARVAGGKGLPVLEGTLDLGVLQERLFDVITLWDVIEHFDDPNQELEKVYALLKPGGFVAVHTMDIESLAAKMMGRRWPWLMDMHIHYFSRNTLAQLLRQCGFEIVWTGSQGRYLSLGYLTTRLAGLSKTLGRLSHRLVHAIGREDTTVPVNFGDLFTIYARRPQLGQNHTSLS